jgi:hypothetical protein
MGFKPTVMGLAATGLLWLQASSGAALVQLRAAGALNEDLCPYPGSGGSNGDAEPGEGMQMAVTVVNTPATEDATAVVVTTSTASPGVTILPGTETVTIGTVPRNDRTTGTTTVDFVVDPDFPCPGTITFTFDITCSQGECPFQNPSDIVVPVACIRCAGACCAGDGSCDHTRDEVECAVQGGSYQGDVTDCATTTCPGPASGACCQQDGSCSVETPAGCGQLAGQYQGDDVACTPGLCPPGGACCDSAGVCTVRTQAACAGLYLGDGIACDPNPCPPAGRGACCTGSSCAPGLTSAECGAVGGTYQGDGVGCAPNPCGGACCDPATGGCTFTTAAGCAGNFTANGTECTPSPCPQPGRGACCAGTSCTANLTASECGTGGGTYQGDGTACAPNPCCDAGLIQAIGQLRCSRLGNDVRLSWSQDPQALSGYNVWYVQDKSALPACNPTSCPGSLPVGGCQPTGAVDAVLCSHVGSVPATAGSRLYYGVRGVCRGTEAGQ